MELAQLAAQVLGSKLGKDISIRDLREVSEVTDYSVVVSGTSPPHLKALFNEVQHVLKEAGEPCYRKAGDPDCGWLLVDYIEVVIHIFLEETRSYYSIEDLWAQAPQIEVPHLPPHSSLQ
ncbi:MAG: ribosome silencing factor [Kiritimatiellae bacterium]|nr:ribosome silencing factor [Kiritimatiellia bacterium]